MARFIAIDWDHQQLHIVAVKTSGTKMRIEKAIYSREEMSPNPAEAESLGKLLRERLKAAGIAPAPIVVAIGRDRLILKELRYPPVVAHEEANIVRFQALREITDPPDEIIFDYTSAGEPTAKGETRSWALVLRREMLQTYQTLCEAAGLKLLGICPRSFGTIATLGRVVGATVLTPAPEPPDAAVAILALGGGWAEFSITRNKVLLFSRSMATTANIAGEVKRNLSVFAGQNAGTPARALYFAGAGEHGEVWEKLQSLLDIPVHALDPFAGSEGAEVPATNRGGFVGAVGLAQWWTEEQALPINFVSPKKARPPRDPRKFWAVAGVAGAAALMFGMCLLGYWQTAKLNDQIAKLVDQRGKLKKELDGAEEEALRLKALDDWSKNEIVWLDELYDMVDRFPELDKMRVVQLSGDGLARTAKSKYAARMTVRVMTKTDTKVVDDLVSEVLRDGHYRADPKQTERNTGLDRFSGFNQQFTTKFDIESRPPSKYGRKFEPRVPDMTRGRRGAGGPGDTGFGFGFGGMQP